MRVAVLEVELFIPYAHSLKDKRMVIKRVIDRLAKFNVAVAEVAHQDVWQRAGLGIVAISTSGRPRRAAAGGRRGRDRSHRTRDRVADVRGVLDLSPEAGSRKPEA